MNSVVQNYIDLANAEIRSISAANPTTTQELNVYWNTLGTQLKVEQRSRYAAISPAPIPKTPFLNPYGMSTNVFVDTLPNLAQDTRPHMTAQTIEAITDYSNVGGQSAVGMMRQERNQVRLADAGITLDNNIASDLSATDIKTLTTNGTIPAGVDNNIRSPVIDYIKDTTPDLVDGIDGYTNPSWHIVEIDGTIVSPVPQGTYAPSGTNLTGTFVPAGQTATPDPITGGLRLAIATAPGSIAPVLQGNPLPVVAVNVPVLGSTLTDTPTQVPTRLTGLSQPIIVRPPAELDPSNTPDNLNPNYTGSTLLPGSYSVRDAIDKVVECNCDCWIT